MMLDREQDCSRSPRPFPQLTSYFHNLNAIIGESAENPLSASELPSFRFSGGFFGSFLQDGEV